MSLAGKQLLAREVARLAHNVGWRDRDVIIATAVCSAESSRYTQADNTDAQGQPTNPDGSIDYGLWQINSVHLGQVIAGSPVTVERLLDPVQNARIAYALWLDQSWTPWAAYGSGAYQAQVEGAIIGFKNYWFERFNLPLATVEKAG